MNYQVIFNTNSFQYLFLDDHLRLYEILYIILADDFIKKAHNL